jgi:hypothetical protein
MTRRRLLPTLATLLAALCAPGAFAAKAHEHGVARLDVAAGPGKVSIALDTPLENLVGFERAPRDDAERQRADEAVRLLKSGDTLLQIDPAARCTLTSVQLRSAALGLGPADASPKDAGHADLEAEYLFDCKGGAPGFVEVGLFAAFPRLQRLEVQAASTKGQIKRTLQRPASRIGLAR